MNYTLTLQGTQDALASLGIKKNDILLVHSDLRALGMPLEMSNPNEIIPFYHKALESVTGTGGTLAVPAYFYDYARFGEPFDVDNSPVSLSLGSFSIYLAGLAGRVRSCNPLQSIAAVGAKAEALAGGNSLSGYGVTSPWHRLREMGGKMLFIGVNIQPMTYVHYIEQQYGVPHLYFKVYSIPVLRGGKKLSGNSVSAVRYLDFGIEYDLSKFEEELTRRGFLKIASLGKGTIRCVGAKEAFETGIECLDKDPYFFLKEPPHFVSGRIPSDGPTGKK